MQLKHIWSLLVPLYMCACQVLSEHPCGESPLRRFASLTRILNDVYPGREISTAMTLMRETNPELHRRLQSEWRQYTDCVTMVDNGYFKRSSPIVLSSENKATDQLGRGRASSVDVESRDEASWSTGSRGKSRLSGVLAEGGGFTE